jgi:hypothetical protein
MAVGDIARAAMLGNSGATAALSPPPTMPTALTPTPVVVPAAAVVAPLPTVGAAVVTPVSEAAPLTDAVKGACIRLYNSWAFKYVALFVTVLIILMAIKPPFVRERVPPGAQDDPTYDPPCSTTRVLVVAMLTIAIAAVGPVVYDHWGSVRGFVARTVAPITTPTAT